MKASARRCVFFSFLLIVSCSESVQPDAGPRTDSGGADSGGADSGGADSGGADSGGADGGARFCGGLGGGVCDATEFCDYADNICGADDGGGECRPRPGGCPDVVDPVCACDGTVYGNACDANAAGVDVNSVAGACTPEPGSFLCGFRVCTTDTYCTITNDDTGMPPAYSCAPFPAACGGGARNCACVAAEPCGELCMLDSDGNVIVTCLGG